MGERTCRDIVERFEEKFSKTDGCWIWNGVQNGRGYGSFHILKNGKRYTGKAHRFSYELYKGPIPDGLYVLHSCDNRLCVNPDHLSVGTHTDNMRDAARKGRICNIGRGRRTHCPKGHPFAGENLYVSPNGHRKCRECIRVSQRLKYLERNPHIVPLGPRKTIRGES